ncbi:MAG: hypothetical protein ABIO70_32340 [Pseudomonadota bacterium]
MKSQLEGHQKIGVALATLTIAIPGLLVSGFLFPVETVGLTVALLGVALVGGGASGLILAWRRHRWLGAFAGLVAGPGGFLATAGWCSLRDSIWNLEIALTLGIGALPGLLIYLVGAKLLDKRATSSSSAR